MSNDDFQDWVGREEVRTELIGQDAVLRMAATLGVAPPADDTLPAGWHWLFFNPVVAADQLGEDGHPARRPGAGILPPVPLERRMWAGSRVEYLAGVPVGAMATRRSLLQRVTFKEGRAGRICFVSVLHQLEVQGRVCIREAQDIVYKAATPVPAVPAAASASTPAVPIPDAEWMSTITPDPVLLFRYSALTFNGHRIHYDLPYAREVEGYPSLIVHGPLTATLLQDFAARAAPAQRLQGFDFKATHPLYVDEPMHLRAWQEADQRVLKVFNDHGTLAMQATARTVAA